MNISTKPKTILSTLWNSMNEELMMKKSQNSRMRPMDMFLYLLTTAPMISVPPVLPLPRRPIPVRAAHKGADDDRHKRLVAQDGLPFQQPLEKGERTREREDTEDRLDQEFQPQDLRATTTSNTTLMTK